MYSVGRCIGPTEGAGLADTGPGMENSCPGLKDKQILDGDFKLTSIPRYTYAGTVPALASQDLAMARQDS